MTAKKSLFILAVLFFSFHLKAQDTLFKTNGSKMIVKIMEINSSEIKYKMLGSNADLVVTENKNNVHHIIYANGSKEFYNTAVKVDPATIDYVAKRPANSEPYVAPEKEKIYGKNVFAINFFETFFTNFGVSYERISNDGKFSVKIPFSVGLGAKPNVNQYKYNDSYNIDYLRNKIYGTGLELNVYPMKFNRGGFYLGLTGEYGTFNYYTISTTNPYTYIPTYQKNIGIHYAGLFHIGGYLGLTDNILIGGKLALGYKHQETILVDYTNFKMNFDFNLAYRF
jgi:hypothetical protein